MNRGYRRGLRWRFLCEVGQPDWDRDVYRLRAQTAPGVYQGEDLPLRPLPARQPADGAAAPPAAHGRAIRSPGFPPTPASKRPAPESEHRLRPPRDTASGMTRPDARRAERSHWEPPWLRAPQSGTRVGDQVLAGRMRQRARRAGHKSPAAVRRRIRAVRQCLRVLTWVIIASMRESIRPPPT